MRKIDKEKDASEKAAKTISFEVPVLERIEDLAKIQGSTASKVVNFACRSVLMNEIKYFNELALYHERERAKYEFLRNNLVERKMAKAEVKTE